MSKKIILTTGKGKNKRSWEFTEEEFDEFEFRFEENELIECAEDIDNLNITLVEYPKGELIWKK